jgi:thiosulfate/3-mercaptopyruvate sulfurtransferase
MEEIEALVSRGEGGRLVDARDARRYRGETEPIDPVAGHIPGSRNRPYAHNLTEHGTMRPASELQEEWHALLGGVPPSSAISYCGSGVTACQNLLALEYAGLAGSRLFIPSWSGWSSDRSRPVERERD